MKALNQAIRTKFSADKDEYAKETLKRLEEKPREESRQIALANILTEKIEADPKFKEELKQLVQDTIQGKDVAEFLTQVYGGEVGQIVNLNQAGDLTFNN